MREDCVKAAEGNAIKHHQFSEKFLPFRKSSPASMHFWIVVIKEFYPRGLSIPDTTQWKGSSSNYPASRGGFRYTDGSLHENN